MWILDTSVERVPCPPSLLLTLSDPARHWELVEALDAAFGGDPVIIRTIHGEWLGWRDHRYQSPNAT